MREGWEMKKLGDICKISGGGTPSKKNEKYWGGKIPWVSPKDMKFENISTSRDKITPLGLQNGSAKLIPAGSILIVVRSGILAHSIPLGKVTIPVSVNQDIKALTFNSDCDTEFMFYQLLSLTEDLLSKVTRGATVHRIQSEVLRNLTLSVPPLDVQRRIVSRLDAAFAALDQAQANVERCVELAGEVWESVLEEKFDIPINQGYQVTLKDITTKIGSGATPRGGQSAYKEEGTHLIRSMNVHDSSFTFRKIAHIGEDQANALSNVAIEPNDVLLNITGASVARCCLAPPEVIPARVNQHVSIIRPKTDIVRSEYLMSYLVSKGSKKALLEIGDQGSTRQAITKKQIEGFTIILPKTLEAQDKILKMTSTTKISINSAIESYKNKLTYLTNLRSSLLEQAFCGEWG